MCCIFTCCGWMIDLVQRLWTFTMSCCISSAVCCLMVTGSMSGIALGYNYSLAEYIDLKETNVSVYLKRGVFDDELGDDMEFRRSGRLPVAGHIGTDNLMTGAPAEDDNEPLRSGRRLEDSVFESDDPNKYEGSLMKLTAQPPFPGTTMGTTAHPEYAEAESTFSSGSLDQLKAIQGMVNARKSAMANFNNQQKTTYPDIDERYIAQMGRNPNLPPSGRRMMAPSIVDRLNPARLAVPPQSIGSEENWVYPRNPGAYRKRFSFSDIDYPNFSPEYPKPIRLQTGPIRPPRPTPTPEMRTYGLDHEGMTKPSISVISVKPDMGSALKRFKEKMILEKFEAPVHGFPKKPSDSSDDYEEEIKGLPVRRRRSNDESISADADNFIELENYTIIKNISDSILPPIEITHHSKISNSNINYKDVSAENGDNTIVYKNPQLLLRQDTLEETKIITQVNDEIKITIRSNPLEIKLQAKETSKKSEDSSSKEPENCKTEVRKFNGDSKSDATITNVAKTLSTIGISVGDIKPSIMVRILQSTVA